MADALTKSVTDMDITVTKRERIEISCSMDKRQEALDYAYNNGYKISRSGPKSNGDYTVDHLVFHLVAEKEIPT